MPMPLPSTEQRVYDAADNAYLYEGGYLAPTGNDLVPAARDSAAGAERRGSERVPRTAPALDERGLIGRFGSVHSGRVYRYAQRACDDFHDAPPGPRAAARRPH